MAHPEATGRNREEDDRLEENTVHIQKLQEEIERKDDRLEENRVHIERLQNELEREKERPRRQYQE